jgi:predicted metal-binding membrane protein
MLADERHQIAARIAHKLRGADVGCEIVQFLPTDAAVLRRDRITTSLALTLLTALAWSYLVWLSVDMGMGGMDMNGFRMIPSGRGLMIPAHTLWPPIEFAFVFAMWTVMMIGMMIPSAVPMILMYARVGRCTQAQGPPLGATAYFGIGYVLVWVAFSVFATLTQWALERAGLLDTAMASTSNVLAGVIFVAAGSYQWTRLKQVCLAQCQMTFAFLIRYGGFRREAPGALLLGLRHGAYCVGRCWMLMSLLFVGGVMNLLWIGLLALFILLEKVIPGARVAYLGGFVIVAAGTWLLSTTMF